MSELGKRLTYERKRLGLSQSAFAELIGVSFSSQRRYEDGRTSPDTAYLNNLRRHGVDVQYVMTGRGKQTGAGYNPDDLAEFGLALAKRYQISPDEFQGLVNAVSASMKQEEEPDSHDMAAIEKRISSYEAAFFVHASDFFEKRLQSTMSTEVAQLDSSLLAEILKEVDLALLAQQGSIEPAKKAQVAAMLYRAFKAAGKFDQIMLDEAVKLAAS